MRVRDREDESARARGYSERARVEGARVWLELLARLDLWGEASDSLQDLTVSAVLSLLGQSWRLETTERYSCGGQSHRIATLRYLGPDLAKPFSTKTPKDWLFQLIPGGTYDYGMPPDLAPASTRTVFVPGKLVRPLLVGQTAVTQSMWDEIGGDDDRDRFADDCPIHEVSKFDALVWLSRFADDGFRMLTEYEWEFACRAGTSSRYSFGDDPSELGDYAWYRDNSDDEPQAVATKKPNAFGLFDMHGNVSERTRGGGGRLRGGSFMSGPERCGAAEKFSFSSRHAICGLRIGRSLIF